MEIMSYSALRAHLAAAMDKVCDSHDPVVVHRKDSRSVVMLSLEDYESCIETLYLLKSPGNRERLQRGIEEIEAEIERRSKL